MTHQFLAEGDLQVCSVCDLRFNPLFLDGDTLPACRKPMTPRSKSRTAVIVISHNYGRFLQEALESVLKQSSAPAEVLVIDDDSTDNTAEVAAGFAAWGVRYLKTAHHSVYLNRLQGMDETTAPHLVFLDADDVLPVNYLRAAERQLDTDPAVGIVATDFRLFDQESGLKELTDRNIEHSNYVHCAAMVRRSAMLSVELSRDSETRHAHEDWYVWRRLVRAGWKVGRSPVPLRYRRHGESMMDRNEYPYRRGANLDLETVQVVLPLSGRGEWIHYSQTWLNAQTWPNLSLLVLDSGPAGPWREHVRSWLSGLRCETHYVPVAPSDGLADLERRNQPATCDRVKVAMPRLYNIARQRLTSEYVFWLEDDILPPPDAISRLMDGMAADVACVSGLVRSRYEHGRPIEFDQRFQTRDGRGEGLQQTYGTGFGCLLVRRSAIQLEPFHCGGQTGNYDQEFSVAVARAGMRWLIDWSVGCWHQDIAPDGLEPRA